MLAWLVLLGWLLHAATRRWTLSVLDDGLLVARGSWLWSRRVQLPGAASQSLVYKLFLRMALAPQSGTNTPCMPKCTG